MQFSEDDISSVSPQHLRLGFLYTAQLIRIAQNKFTRLQQLFPRISSGNAASFNRRMAHAISEPERLRFGGQSVTVLSPNRFDTSHLPIRFSSRFEYGLELLGVWRYSDKHDMDVTCPE